MKLEFGHVEIFVKDPLKSKDFYIDVLGFELIEVQGDSIAWLKMGENAVLLRPGKFNGHAGTYQTTNMAIVIYTDDVEGTLNRYKQRGLVIKGDDTGCPVFTDPDGNWFQLVNPKEHQD
jgi:catechol 2,3-dioxygenase-like lactoylglutathione lyase family enzyme